MNDHRAGHDAGDGADSQGLQAGWDPVIRAEQALLGAVMSDPLQQAAILDLVRPGDMRRPYHGQVLAAMQRLRGRNVPPEPAAVRAELAADPDMPSRVALDGILLVGLLEAAPRPGHAPAYAAMVIDHGIRLQLQLAGSRMAQAAEAGDLEAAKRMTVQGGRDVRDCQQRWDALPETMRRELQEPAVRRAAHAAEAVFQLQAASEEIARAREDVRAGMPGEISGRLESIGRHIASAAASGQPSGGGDVQKARERRPRGQEAVAAGESFLRDLAAGPGQIIAVHSWLRPRHFARPAHGDVYALMVEMHAAGKPIDPVTVAWEAAGRGIPADAADVDGGTAPFAVAGAREVHRYGLLAQIGHAGREISANAADLHVQTGGLLRGVGQRLRQLGLEPRSEADVRPRGDGRSRTEARPGALPSSGSRRVATQLNGRTQARPSNPTAEPA
jgi:hypothetical protein